jgi:hypothetical protein
MLGMLPWMNSHHIPFSRLVWNFVLTVSKGATADIENNCIYNSAVGFLDSPTGGATTGGEWDLGSMKMWGGYYFNGYYSRSELEERIYVYAPEGFEGDHRHLVFGEAGEVLSDITWHFDGSVTNNTFV